MLYQYAIHAFQTVTDSWTSLQHTQINKPMLFLPGDSGKANTFKLIVFSHRQAEEKNKTTEERRYRKTIFFYHHMGHRVTETTTMKKENKKKEKNQNSHNPIHTHFNLLQFVKRQCRQATAARHSVDPRNIVPYCKYVYGQRDVWFVSACNNTCVYVCKSMCAQCSIRPNRIEKQLKSNNREIYVHKNQKEPGIS